MALRGGDVGRRLLLRRDGLLSGGIPRGDGGGDELIGALRAFGDRSGERGAHQAGHGIQVVGQELQAVAQGAGGAVLFVQPADEQRGGVGQLAEALLHLSLIHI